MRGRGDYKVNQNLVIYVIQELRDDARRLRKIKDKKEYVKEIPTVDFEEKASKVVYS